jgi:hypothetical protein
MTTPRNAKSKSSAYSDDGYRRKQGRKAGSIRLQGRHANRAPIV